MRRVPRGFKVADREIMEKGKPSWGGMLADGWQPVDTGWWRATLPGFRNPRDGPDGARTGRPAPARAGLVGPGRARGRRLTGDDQ
jgi:hypothetical protein